MISVDIQNSKVWIHLSGDPNLRNDGIISDITSTDMRTMVPEVKGSGLRKKDGMTEFEEITHL